MSNPAANVASYPPLEDHDEIVGRIWGLTIGKGGSSTPEQRVYQRCDLRKREAPSARENEMMAEVLNVSNTSGTIFDSKSLNRKSRVVSAPVGIPNYFTVRIKFKDEKEKTITIHQGLNPEPGVMHQNWKIAEYIQFQSATVQTDPNWIMFMDLHPANANSPLRWTPDKLDACGIERFVLSQAALLKQAYFEWTSGGSSADTYDDRDAKLHKAAITSDVMRLPFAKAKAIVMALNGPTSFTGIEVNDLQAHARLLLLGYVEDVNGIEKLKKELIGQFPDVYQALVMAEANKSVVFKDSRWMMATGNTEEDSYIPIPGGEMSEAQQRANKDLVMHLASILYGRIVHKGIQYEVINQIMAVSSARNKATIPAVNKSDVNATTGTPADVILDESFEAVITAAVADGKIVMDRAAKMFRFNPFRPGDDELMSTHKVLGGFKLEGATIELQMENALNALIGKFKGKQDKMKVILHRLGAGE